MISPYGIGNARCETLKYTVLSMTMRNLQKKKRVCYAYAISINFIFNGIYDSLKAKSSDVIAMLYPLRVLCVRCHVSCIAY